MEVTRETIIGDVLDYDIETAQFFFEIGMHCLGCPHSRGESTDKKKVAEYLKTVKSRYPDAFLVQFKNGIRVSGK